MSIKTIGIWLVSLLVLAACKKREESLIPEPQDGLLVKRIVTVLQERSVQDPFTSREELVFDYDDANRLIKISNRTIHQFTDHADTMERGYEDFVYDQQGKLIRRNRYSGQGVLGWYEELTYGGHDLPGEVSLHQLQWDPVAEKAFFQLRRYDKYTYNASGKLAERVTHELVGVGNDLSAMTPVFRALFDYDERANVRLATVYPLVEMYGVPGKPAWKEEYRYAGRDRAPLYFGLTHSPFYTSTGIMFAYSAEQLMWQKTTVYYESQGFAPTYQTRDFTIQTGKHGHPETIREVYIRDVYLRPAGVEAPLLVAERGERVSNIEYVASK